jgi:hypothetical protein
MAKITLYRASGFPIETVNAKGQRAETVQHSLRIAGTSYADIRLALAEAFGPYTVILDTTIEALVDRYGDVVVKPGDEPGAYDVMIYDDYVE